MDELVCNQAEYFPSYADFAVLRSTLIANSIFNVFLIHTTIMLNIVTICAIRRASTLPNNLKTLLMSLAISDVSGGLLGQPVFTAFLVSWQRLNDPNCNAYRMLNISGYMFASASFLGVVAVSVDRFLAIHSHLRYLELVTPVRVFALVISIWVFSAFLSGTVFWTSVSTRDIIIIVTVAFGSILTIVLYLRIYLTVRRHKNQIQSLQVHDISQSGEMTNLAGLIKSAVGAFYIYLLFLLCYLPYSLLIVVIKLNGPSIALKRVYLFSVTLVYLNSSLNPVIYCWKMRHIRHAIMDILRNISWNRNGPSHSFDRQSSGWPKRCITKHFLASENRGSRERRECKWNNEYEFVAKLLCSLLTGKTGSTTMIDWNEDKRKLKLNLKRKNVTVLNLFACGIFQLIYNGNRTGWSPVWSVSKGVITTWIGRLQTGKSNLSIMSMITYRIGWRVILLPINHNHYNCRKNQLNLFEKISLKRTLSRAKKPATLEIPSFVG